MSNCHMKGLPKLDTECGTPSATALQVVFYLLAGPRLIWRIQTSANIAHTVSGPLPFGYLDWIRVEHLDPKFVFIEFYFSIFLLKV